MIVYSNFEKSLSGKFPGTSNEVVAGVLARKFVEAANAVARLFLVALETDPALTELLPRSLYSVEFMI